MNNLMEKIIGEIKTDLLEGWNNASTLAINRTVDSTTNDKAQKYILREKLKSSSLNTFNQYWGEKIERDLTAQYTVLHEKIESQLCARHPWLKDETESESITLKNNFLNSKLKNIMFELLIKSNSSKKWSDIVIKDDTKFQWIELNDEVLTNEIQGYPLSNPDFYKSRGLTSFLSNPFSTQPKRYDVYRILVKNYKTEFNPQNLRNKITSTKIAPLHYKELKTLSEIELNNFETILVNIGNEDSPEWVLLNKKSNQWTLYVTGNLTNKFREKINEECFEINYQITEINTPESPIYSNTTDWHAILFSRILPWCNLKGNIPNLLEYRSTIPIQLLLQNTIESSCLNSTEQTQYATNAKKAFSKRNPLSDKTEIEIYNNANQDLVTLLSDIQETTADEVISAFDNKKLEYIGNTLKINDSTQFQNAMKLVYFHKIQSINIESTLPQNFSKQWFEYNLNLKTINASNDLQYSYIHACAARNRFLAIFKPNYLNENEIGNRKEAWRNTGLYIYNYLTNQTDSINDQLPRNIAEMGIEGLNVLFNHLNTLNDAANLDCSLDLNCGKSCTVTDYISNLTSQINEYNKTPLFNKLTLNLPDDVRISENNFYNLILTLNNKGKLHEVSFKNQDNIKDKFLDNLIIFVKNHKICMQIKIPDWDNSAYKEDKAGLIAKYRQLQNTILKNIREKIQTELNENTKTIESPLPVINPLKSTDNTEIDQTWSNTKTYALASSSAGVQQQAQQEIAQEVQQEAQQQAKPKAPTTKTITEYTGSNDGLKTRANCDNEPLFSSCVGSTKDATFVIRKMDEKAFEHIKKYQNLFKFGIDWERTPGFKLYYEKDTGALILTYDEKSVNEDIKTLKQNSDPFSITMNDTKTATNFYGDYRQIQDLDISNSVQNQATLWHYLATEHMPEPITSWLNTNNSESRTSEELQSLNASRKMTKSLNKEAMIQLIKSWSQQNNTNSLNNDLFDKLTDENLRSFGQLFYNYDNTGNEKWLKLTAQINDKFPGKFKIYKERLLDPLYDWSECLEKTEVYALTESMQKLEKHDDHKDILWTLIDAHGKSVGRMRYAEVWNAYNEVIDYIDANELTINKTQFINAINKYGDTFNATQFLRRLNEILHHTGNKQDSRDIQQNILDNLERIDWKENGFYYACIHENYRYWDEDLELNDMESLNQTENATYIPTWDEIELNNITKPLVYTLRYAAQKLKLNKIDFDKFKALIKRVDAECNFNKIEVMRLITASIALGVDTIDDLSALNIIGLNKEEFKDSLKNINKQLKLDSNELASNSYHLRMKDIPKLLITTNEKAKDFTLDNINTYGRALRCCNTVQFTQFNTYINDNDFESPLVKAYPWLINQPIEGIDANEHLDRFYKQLISIDLSKALPSRDQLETILKSINSEESRHTAIKSLISQGFTITDQDADFRKVNNVETTMINEIYLSKPFRAQNNKLLNKLFEKLAIKQDGNTNVKINNLLTLFSKLDTKIYYDELGQLLGLLIEKAEDEKCYSVEQLTTWLEKAFDTEEFKTKPYPVGLIKELLIDALQDENSSLLNKELSKLKINEPELEKLQNIMQEINKLRLSDQAKKTLAKCAIKFKKTPNENNHHMQFQAIFTTLKNSTRVTESLCNLIAKQLQDAPNELLENIDILKELTKNCTDSDEEIQKLWKQNQVKLIEILNTNGIKNATAITLINIAHPLIKTILVAAFTNSDDQELIKTVLNKLSTNPINEEQLKQLAIYYSSEPKPTLLQLDKLISQSPINTINIINEFEREVQTKDKRNYSLTEEDRISLKRVLSGFKLKQSDVIPEHEQENLLTLLYYMNSYSEVMNLKDKNYDDLLNIIQSNKTETSNESKARILACMREVVVRKTGKWAKHTQMIDLLYGAIHNNESLMHQVRTGEGKSLISLMRVAYRALSGQIVDVYSSKESLSARDHKEFGIVLDTFKIRNSYITARSTRDQYYDKKDNQGVGAVHYATMSGFDLFLTGNQWEGKEYINIHAENRVAILDEGDAIFNQETLNQLPIQTGANSIYNYDAWVYGVAYEYYETNKNNFQSKNFILNEDPDLKDFYMLLQRKAKEVAPTESQFFKKYLASGSNDLRNQKLVQLLTATHVAQNMTEGVEFCEMTEQKNIDDSVTIETRAAKVLIENQIALDSSFSELVHQALHFISNKKAVDSSKTPNFFIEPESEIALSLNARYTVKNFYKLVEAFTGTAGDKDAVAFYKSEFNISRVIKLPTHKDIKTIYLPPIYSMNEDDGYNDLTEEQQQNKDIEAHVKAILESIQREEDRPILMPCKDDKSVAAIGKLIQDAFSNEPAKYAKRHLIIDTNASGLSETVALANSGKKGYVSLSSRAGRGSDIKLEDEAAGLRVIRLYEAPPEVVKQEQGRQGRNGAGGECQDILNYGEIKREVDKVENTELFKKMLLIETEHLNQKLVKHNNHKKANKNIWSEIYSNEKLKEQYLQTRTLSKYNAHLNKTNKEHIRKKEALIIEGSILVMDKLHSLTDTQQTTLKEAWIACRKNIETNWTTDDNGEASQNILKDFYTHNDISKPERHTTQHTETSEIEDDHSLVKTTVPIESLISFHQKWLEKLKDHNNDLTQETRNLLYGQNGADIEELYGAFKTLNEDQIKTLLDTIQTYPILYNISCSTWAGAIRLIVENDDISEDYVSRLNTLSGPYTMINNNIQNIQQLNKNFLAAVEGAPDISFLKDIIKTNFDNDERLLNIVGKFNNKVVKICKDLMNNPDRVFFITQLKNNSNETNKTLDFLVKNYATLQRNPEVIRPFIPLLLQHDDHSIFNDLEYNNITPSLISFLNQRPNFDKQEYVDLKNKIDAIEEDADKERFLLLISEIPPYINVKCILQDLRDQPGKYSFKAPGYNELCRRINFIKESATSFNEYLFINNIINNKSTFTKIINKNDYDVLMDIYSTFTRDMEGYRNEFFISINLADKKLTEIRNIYHNFNENKDIIQLHKQLRTLLETKTKSTSDANTHPVISSTKFFKEQTVDNNQKKQHTQKGWFSGGW